MCYIGASTLSDRHPTSRPISAFQQTARPKATTIADERGGRLTLEKFGLDDGAQTAAILPGATGLFTQGKLPDTHRITLLGALDQFLGGLPRVLGVALRCARR
jgi:hypothetical protein